MNLTVDPGDPTPPYEQVRRQISDLVGSGSLRAGDRLPPLRQLAGDLGLAVGTVARAYRELEAAGVLVSRRGAGTRVAPLAAPTPDVVRRGRLRELSEAHLLRARALGCSDAEVVAAVGAATRDRPPDRSVTGPARSGRAEPFA